MYGKPKMTMVKNAMKKPKVKKPLKIKAKTKIKKIGY